MHDEHVEEHLAYAMPPSAQETAPPPEPPTSVEWAIGIVFVLAALAIVTIIGWTIWTL